MTGLDRNQTPKTRPMPQNRTALVASLDIGTSKIACMIARLKPCPPNEALRGRSHAVELIGYSQIQSRGVKAGAVADLAECEQAVRHAVAMAERMAKVRVESVLLSVSAGRLQGQLIEAAADIKGGAVTSADVTRITSTGMRHATGEGRTVLHALPVGYALDGVKGIRDPRGMVARQFGVDMNVVTADASVAKNLMLVVERCHLNVEAMAASPYVAGLSVLTDDEADIGAAVVEMGAGTTTIAIYSGGPLRARIRICARRATHHHGYRARPQCMHCRCRANQDVIWHRADRWIRRARIDVRAGGRRQRTRCSADRVPCHDCKHRSASRRGDFRNGPGPPRGFSFCSRTESAGCPQRRGFAAHRLCRTRQPDSRPSGAYRPSARFWPFAQ